MENFVYICKTVVVFLFLCLLKIEDSLAETGHVRTDGDFSWGDQNQNYFFYQQSEYPRDCKETIVRCSSLNASGIYVIKPDGYPEPFEVHCDDDGWMVVQRRMGGFVQFIRGWKDYKEGFGFLSHEFWLGNDKLSHLTNQADYELRVDLQLSNGSSFGITYRKFRVSDEWAGYELVSLGEYNITGDWSITTCPDNMVYGNCTCGGTCERPGGSSGCHSYCDVGNEGCFCPDGFLMDGDECVSPSECSCFWPEVGHVVPIDHTMVNEDCTERRTCTNNQLVLDSEYRCDSNARCTIQDDERQCYCDDGFHGDGQHCEALYTDCYDAYTAGQTEDGVYLIKPTIWPGSAFNVSCVMNTHGGGWTVFQRRTGIDRSINFYRNWTSYRDGFGSLSGDFWLVNEKLYHLSNQKTYKLRVDMLGSSGSVMWTEYSSFRIDDEETKYHLRISGQNQNTGGYGYFGYGSGKPFSTYDQDNDGCERHDCAERHRGGWWYSGEWCSHTRTRRCMDFTYGNTASLCTDGNLNGDYNGGSGENIFWLSSRHSDYCNLDFAEMKIRPSS